MPLPLDEQLCEALKVLGISIDSHSAQLLKGIGESCKTLRSRLLVEEASQTRRPISNATFWDITPKYRFDALQFEMVYVADQLAYSIGFASIYLDQVPAQETLYRQSTAKLLSLYHLDYGFRLVSSAWDRVALLLDLGFELDTRSDCSFATVMRELPKKDENVVYNDNFKALKEFRDTRFADVEAGRGEGLRHEVTHLLTLRTRLFCESVGDHLPNTPIMSSKMRLTEWRDLLVEHYQLYLSGIRNAMELVRLRLPPTPQ